jgi:hypothetical protein
METEKRNNGKHHESNVCCGEGLMGESSMHHVRFSETLKGVLIYNYEICEK